jgi:hypothetical protein
MAHLAGALAVPVVVVAAQLDAGAIHGFWPKSVQLRGPLACSGCRWTGPHFRPACQTLCASLQAITPEHVRDAVLGAAGRPPTVADVLEIVAAKLGGVPTQWGAADRDRTLGWLFREMAARFPDGPRVVETGCVRERDDWGAGYFGYLCGMWLEAVGGGELISVDNDPAHVRHRARAVPDWTRARVVQSCSVAYLEGRTEPIDVAYLDSMDTYVAGHDAHGLREARAAAKLVAPNGLILFDDSPPDGAGGWRGKGRPRFPGSWRTGGGCCRCRGIRPYWSACREADLHHPGHARRPQNRLAASAPARAGPAPGVPRKVLRGGQGRAGQRAVPAAVDAGRWSARRSGAAGATTG